MTKEKIDRINELARKKKSVGLTEAELEEQALLRREYIESYKQSLVAQLENTYIVEPDGLAALFASSKEHNARQGDTYI